MAGIYVHVPFCKTRCAYCDFYSTTFGTDVRERYVARVCRELVERRGYICGAQVTGVYLGGGTPTRLTTAQLRRICHAVFANFNVAAGAEVTLEANPDDLSLEYVAALRTLPFNRVSMGVQSFSDGQLRAVGRRHTAAQAVEAYGRLRRAGFANVSLDLIYGFPGESMAMWQRDVEQAVALRPEHLSAYALTYEPGTPLTKKLNAGELAEAGEDTYINMYAFLVDRLVQAGYEHYEISNFAQPGRRAVLNSLYWKGECYLGVGPGAHSFDGRSRRANACDVEAYAAAKGDVPNDTELLDDATMYDEMVMTRLRTCEGLELSEVAGRFGRERLDYLLANAQAPLAAGLLELYCEGERRMLRFTKKGIFVSDGIMSDLMEA